MDFSEKAKDYRLKNPASVRAALNAATRQHASSGMSPEQMELIRQLEAMGGTVVTMRDDVVPRSGFGGEDGSRWQVLKSYDPVASRCYKTLGMGFMTNSGKLLLPPDVPQCYVDDPSKLETDDIKIQDWVSLAKQFAELDQQLDEAEYNKWLARQQYRIALYVTNPDGTANKDRIKEVEENWQLTDYSALQAKLQQPLVRTEGETDAEFEKRTERQTEKSRALAKVFGEGKSVVARAGMRKLDSRGDPMKVNNATYLPDPAGVDVEDDWVGKALDPRTNKLIDVRGTLGKRDDAASLRAVWLPRTPKVIPERFRKAPSVIHILPKSETYKAVSSIADSMKKVKKEEKGKKEIHELAKAVRDSVRSGRLEWGSGILRDARLGDKPKGQSVKAYEKAITETRDGAGKSWADSYLMNARKCVDLTEEGLGPFGKGTDKALDGSGQRLVKETLCRWSPTLESWVRKDLIAPSAVERMERGMDDEMAAWYDGFVKREKQRASKRDAAVARYFSGKGSKGSKMSPLEGTLFAASPVSGGDFY